MENKAKNKAKELVEKYNNYAHSNPSHESELFYRRLKENSIKCALICVENEYRSLRELLFNLRSSSVIENEKVYLTRLNELIDEESEVRDELNKMK